MQEINIHLDQHQKIMASDDEFEKEAYLKFLRNLIEDGNSLFLLKDGKRCVIWFDNEEGSNTDETDMPEP